MNPIERACIKARHLPLLSDSDRLWNVLRPAYNFTVGAFAKRGLKRRINGQDELLVSPKWRRVQETYEPEFWRSLVGEINAGDVFVDVGGFIGLYSICLARRVGPSGKVYVFEPDTVNYSDLCEHVNLNGVSSVVKTFNSAVTDFDGLVSFHGGASSESRIELSQSSTDRKIRCCKLDSVFTTERIAVVKIDVEGLEEYVLRGARNLLTSDQSPRSIYLEVHPFAWERTGTSSDSLLYSLESCGYRCFTLDGMAVTAITEYGSVVARKKAK